MTPPSSSRVKETALRLAQPLAAYLELTYACNWRCAFCYNPRRSDTARLSAAEWLAVLDDLRSLGTLAVTLTGGEPLAHPEFLEIARAVRERAFALRVFTNGSLVDDAAAEAIAALHPQAVEATLHGATAATHDRATATAGSFDALWRGVGRLRARGVRLFLKSPLTRLNEGELEGMAALAAGLGIPLHVDPVLTPRDDGDASPLAWAASPEGVASLMRLPGLAPSLRPVQREPGGVACGLGRLTLAVDPEGEVFPCLQWRRDPIGNVRTTRLALLWPSSPGRLRAARVAEEANDALLSAGGPAAVFPFCPAVALQRHGDPLVPDAGTLFQARLAAAARAEAGP